MPLNSSLCSRRLEVVGARKNGSDEWLSPFFFFSSKRLCKGHAQRNEAKGSLAKIVGKRSAYCIFICSSTFMNCSMHFAAKLLPLNKVRGLPVKKVRTRTFIKIVPYRSLDLNCNLWLFFSELSATSQAMHSNSASIMQCKCTISFTIVSRGDWLWKSKQRHWSLKLANFCLVTWSRQCTFSSHNGVHPVVP